VAIAKAHGVDAKDLAKWNDIDDPRRLQIGQKIRLSPPGG
jgi:N-acetylmuramoyl-L-alanine amidase